MTIIIVIGNCIESEPLNLSGFCGGAPKDPKARIETEAEFRSEIVNGPIAIKEVLCWLCALSCNITHSPSRPVNTEYAPVYIQMLSGTNGDVEYV